MNINGDQNNDNEDEKIVDIVRKGSKKDLVYKVVI
jgi:hypothetical protein